MKNISHNVLDADEATALGLCPICKVNYITEDETVCSTCYADSDLTDEEISALYGDKAHQDNDEEEEEDDENDGLIPVEDDDLGFAEEDDLELLNVAGIDNEDAGDEEEELETESLDDLEEDEDDEFDDDDLDFDEDDDGDDEDEDDEDSRRRK